MLVGSRNVKECGAASPRRVLGNPEILLKFFPVGRGERGRGFGTPVIIISRSAGYRHAS